MIIYLFIYPSIFCLPSISLSVYLYLYLLSISNTFKNINLYVDGNHSQKSSPFQSSLITSLRIQHASTAIELSILKEAMNKPLSQRLENFISSLLIQTLSDMLNKYKQTIDDDEIFLNNSYDLIYNNNNVYNNDNNFNNNNNNCDHDSGTNTTYQFIYPNQRHINAIIMCYCEKIVLRNAIEWIKLHTNNLNP